MNPVSGKERGPGDRNLHPAGALILSSVVAALGVFAIVTAFRHQMPLAFGLTAGLTLLFVATWNLATKDRQTEYPEGGWLTAMSILTITTGVSAVFSPLWPLGLFMVLSGILGLFVGRQGG
jgi:uncharacterized membrane protein HdeD (DUF308 family)